MRVLVAFLTLAPLLAAQNSNQPSHSDLPFAESDIRRVLILARDAALQQQRPEDGMLGGWLPEHIQTLMAGFRTIDDWQDAAVLQKGATKCTRLMRCVHLLTLPQRITNGYGTRPHK